MHSTAQAATKIETNGKTMNIQRGKVGHLENEVIIIVYYYNATSLYSSGGLRSPQQSMIQILLLVMMICIRLGTAEAGGLRYL